MYYMINIHKVSDAIKSYKFGIAEYSARTNPKQTLINRLGFRHVGPNSLWKALRGLESLSMHVLRISGHEIGVMATNIPVGRHP